jgi:hypothetical protein
MNPVPAIAAVEAAVGRQPLATLQALAEAVTGEAPPQLAAPGGAVDAVRLQRPAETQASQRPLEHLLQPALLTALHAPPSDPARPRQLPEGRREDERRDDPAGDERQGREAAPDDAPPDEGPVSSSAATDAAADRDEGPQRHPDALRNEASGPEASSLVDLLRAQGPAEAVADLTRGRRVLLVLPVRESAGPWQAAQAWLLDGRRARRFSARWWPGVPGTPGESWPAWRLFRDGDPLLARGLVSRSGACRLRLGAAPAQRIADPASHAIATLAMADRQRFAESLGGQWSVVLTIAPPDIRTP